MIEQVLVNDENIEAYRNFIDDYDYEVDIDGYLFKEVKQYGGEGCGDSWWLVFSIEKEGTIKHYRVDGWYASYHGRDIDPMNYREVKAVEKTVIVWE